MGGVHVPFNWMVLNENATSNPEILFTGGAVLFLSTTCSQNGVSAVSSKFLIFHMSWLWEYTTHDQDWQEITVTQMKAWDIQLFDRGWNGGPQVITRKNRTEQALKQA